MKKTFGPHLMIDAYACNKKVLNDANGIYAMLDELPPYIGMRKLTLPYVVHAEANTKNDPGGWSGFVIIQESHISIHTFPARRFATIDVYSCKPFDTDAAVAYFKKMLKTTQLDIFLQQRGTQYPAKNIA